MDGININDLTIEQNLRLTQEHQTPSMVKKVDDITIAEYTEYKERIKRQYSRNSGSYFPTYFVHCTSSDNTTLEFPRNTYFNPIPPNTEFSYDSKDMELDEEAGCTTDEESVMKMEKHMSKQEEKNKEDALIAIIKSIREECMAVHKNKQIKVTEADLKKSSEVVEDTVNNDSFTNASNNIMPRSIYEYLKLANHGGAAMSVEMDDMTQQETLKTVKNVVGTRLTLHFIYHNTNQELRKEIKKDYSLERERRERDERN
ncbi:hypothetical protein Tco_1495595 [Tanacetum coccineum]